MPAVPIAIEPPSVVPPPSAVPAPADVPRVAPATGALARRRLNQARELVMVGRTHSAREILNALVQDRGVRPQALVALAELSYKTGDYAEAVRFAAQASSAGAGPEALMVRASAHLRLGNGPKAEADFARVLALQPKNAEAAEGRKLAAQLTKEQP
jgi:Flp pilus assembly protein TadD